MASSAIAQRIRAAWIYLKRRAAGHSPQQPEIFQSMLESMSDGMVVCDTKENFIVFNRAAARILGIGATPTTSEKWSETYGLFEPNGQKRIAKEKLPLYQALQGVEVDEFEMFVRNPEVRDGNYISVNARPMRDAEGRINGALAVFRDITEKQRLKDDLLQAQKMEAIGALAAGIAHDFNNMLASILGNVDVQKFHAQPGDAVREAADGIERACQRAIRLTRQLLDFSRRGDKTAMPMDLHGSIEEICDLMSRTLAKNIFIRKNLQAGASLIHGDPDKMQQVFLNLVVNARDALSESGGEITLETVEVEENGKSYVRVSVSDNGCGVPQALQSRIFDPFFTTKPRGKGTGMGLSMVYSIVKDHGGRIEVRSTPEKGSCFDVYFPMIGDAPKVQPYDSVDRLAILPGSGHILLVDDEELVRQATEKLLLEIGYRVTVAADGMQALQYYEEHHESVDLVFMDLAMPQLGGFESAARMRLINPRLRIVLTSGNSVVRDEEAERRVGSFQFVQKPYDVATLSRALSGVLKS